MKNKIVNITILLLLVGFIIFRVSTAWNQMGQNGAEISDEPEVPSTYYGTIPCADCPGIEYVLHLDENYYTELRWYIDKNPAPIEKTGNWEKKSDSLYLYYTDGEVYQTFLFSENQLTLLDREQNIVTSDLANHYQLERLHEATSIRRHHNQLKEDGVTFFATGNEPFWNIRIIDGETMAYADPELETAFDHFDVSSENKESEYRAENDNYTLHFTIRPEFCRDSMSGYIFTHSVFMSFNQGETYQGCGQFLKP